LQVGERSWVEVHHRHIGEHGQRFAGGHDGRRILSLDLDRQLLPLSDQFFFALKVIHRGDGGGDGFQLVLSGLPVTLIDELLNLRHLGLRGQDHRVVSNRLLTEEHGAQPVERVTGASTADKRTEPAEAQHRGGCRTHHCQREPSTVPNRTAVQHSGGLVGGHQLGRRSLADVVAPARQQVRQFGLVVIARVYRLLGCQRIEELIGAVDLVERGIPTVGSPASEVRHGHLP
jgi:hypothetical protein